MRIDYGKWQNNYAQMPLFYKIGSKEAVALLAAMQPGLHTVHKGGNLMDTYDPSYMYLCVAGAAPQWRQPRRSPWAMPYGIDMIGCLGGEVMTLSECSHNIGPKAAFPPSPIEADYLLLQLPEMMAYREAVWPAQQQMLRNLMGIVAQVVIETRALFYRARHGIDMYQLSEEEKGRYTEIHSDPLNDW